MQPSLAQRLGFAFLAAWGGAFFLLSVLTLALGWEYYALPPPQRAGHLYDPLLRSNGFLGLGFGVLGTGLMLLMLIYTLRKALPRARWFPGSASWWLRFHILCGITGPLLIVLHAGVAMPRGLIEVGFWCMLLVALSGAFGRYVFGHLPRAATGVESDLHKAREELQALRARLVADTAHVDAAAIGEAILLARDFDHEVRTLPGLVALDVEVRRRGARIRALLGQATLEPDVRQRATATLVGQLKQKRTLEAFEVSRRLFRLWHLFHAPLAQAMYLIVALHVLYALAFGGVLRTLRAGLP